MSNLSTCNMVKLNWLTHLCIHFLANHCTKSPTLGNHARCLDQIHTCQHFLKFVMNISSIFYEKVFYHIVFQPFNPFKTQQKPLLTVTGDSVTDISFQTLTSWTVFCNDALRIRTAVIHVWFSTNVFSYKDMKQDLWNNILLLHDVIGRIGLNRLKIPPHNGTSQ